MEPHRRKNERQQPSGHKIQQNHESHSVHEEPGANTLDQVYNFPRGIIYLTTNYIKCY